jgi:hypothetical protein
VRHIKSTIRPWVGTCGRSYANRRRGTVLLQAPFVKLLFTVLSILLVLFGLIGLTDDSHTAAPIAMLGIGMAGIGIAAYKRGK